MLRILHLADIHLGARHEDLADAAAQQRARQAEALVRAVDLAIAEHVELVLLAGDCFNSNVQPKRMVEHVTAQLARLAAAHIRTVLIPGTHDPDVRSSVYRAYDLAAMAGAHPGDDTVTILAAGRTSVHLPSLDLVVVAAVAGPDGTLPATWPEALATAATASPAGNWRIGMAHVAAGVGISTFAGTGVDYLALGGVHRLGTGSVGGVTWGVPGAPEQVTVDQPEPGGVLLVTLDQDGDRRHVTVEPRRIGRSVHRELVIDASTLASQADLISRLQEGASRDVVLDVRIDGVRADALAIEPADVEEALRTAWLRVRVTDRSVPAIATGELPPPDTIAGAFGRELEGRIATLEATGSEADAADAAELREVLHLGRRLLAGEEVTA